MNTGRYAAEELQSRGFRPPMVYVHERARWEYKILSRDLARDGLPTEGEMNTLGTDGWDLAGVVSRLDQVHFYFKRLRS